MGIGTQYAQKEVDQTIASVGRKSKNKRRKTMLPKIKKILYATDLSPNSKYAFGYAINSAIQHDAKIIILHVLEPVAAAVRAQMESYLDDDRIKKIFDEKINYTIELIEKRLKKFCKEELADNPKAADRVGSIEVCEGFAPDEILEKANKLDCDAIVMGTHGKGVIANTFLGSTAKRVLRRARKPIFVIPLPKAEVDRFLSEI
jgi:nucleotide-binding universal stress UspA family protein